MDFGKKIKHGIEEAPIVAPMFAPIPVREPIAIPDVERELVPVRRREGGV